MGKLKHVEDLTAETYFELDKSEVISLLLAYQRANETLKRAIEVYERQNKELMDALTRERQEHGSELVTVNDAISIEDL